VALLSGSFRARAIAGKKKKKSYVCKFRFDRNLQTLNRTLLEASFSLGTHSTPRRVDLLTAVSSYELNFDKLSCHAVRISV
jgi:hypothetical protein